MALQLATNAPSLPDYAITHRRSRALHQVIFNEVVIAASRDAIIVEETCHKPVIYFPPQDVDRNRLASSSRETHCPFKGTARYWSIRAHDGIAPNAAWAYPDPIDDFAPLAGYIAFYLDRMTCHWRDGVPQPLVGPGWTADAPCAELLNKAA